ncbi:hypothetical protein BDK51DRAFT_41447 [Blyttiomyces helicus]|uniref:Uncharacterized protein n=1 Tax=Blyttiomyces helicus TaxID=388810 RepID=A0A4P9WGH3_9FUNG|nr:hypothetical protein BDK51DRAFT_41447 [Blyttiomyces helicus]|eukprot:RKO90130.1 hypothetical protein BDK51DRAFT_41447 [Blyttiomyces helicus]
MEGSSIVIGDTDRTSTFSTTRTTLLKDPLQDQGNHTVIPRSLKRSRKRPRLELGRTTVRRLSSSNFLPLRPSRRSARPRGPDPAPNPMNQITVQTTPSRASPSAATPSPSSASSDKPLLERPPLPVKRSATTTGPPAWATGAASPRSATPRTRAASVEPLKTDGLGVETERTRSKTTGSATPTSAPWSRSTEQLEPLGGADGENVLSARLG